jgi:hypothetical protein
MEIDEGEVWDIYMSIAEVGFGCVRPYWNSMGFFPRNPTDLSAFVNQFCMDTLKDRKSPSYSEASVVEKFAFETFGKKGDRVPRLLGQGRQQTAASNF